jgi:Na+/H+-dicarboxylate symporter
MRTQTINFFGWILFTVSAIGFCIASIGSFWSMFGSCFFLAGCLVFLFHFLRKKKTNRRKIFGVLRRADSIISA